MSESPIESAATAMSTHPRDWAGDHRDAWIYGIIVGWGNALADVAKKHDWTPETVARLRRLRAKAARMR